MTSFNTDLGAVKFETRGKAVAWLELSPRATASPAAPMTASKRRIASLLAGYFAGRSRKLEIPVDLSYATSFAQKVLRACARIPYGRVMTYRELAIAAGRPRAARAVGRVMACNPIPVIIPCHRVIGSDRSLHGFRGGLDLKRKLLELEGVRVRNGRVAL